MTDAIMVFVSTYIAVFALGFQSLNVNRGHYLAAFLTSFLIGGSHIVLYRELPEGDPASTLAYLLAGPIAITSSMWVHRRLMRRRDRDG